MLSSAIYKFGKSRGTKIIPRVIVDPVKWEYESKKDVEISLIVRCAIKVITSLENTSEYMGIDNAFKWKYDSFLKCFRQILIMKMIRQQQNSVCFKDEFIILEGSIQLF